MSLTQTIHAAQNGDKRAFETLMKRFQDRAFAVALAQLGDYHQAEDAVQEAFVEAYLRLGQLQTPIAFPAWLTRIVLGKCVRVARTGKSVPAPVPLDSLTEFLSSAPDPEAVLLERTASEALLQNATRLLSEQEREAFVLFVIGGYRYIEIAEMMELPVSLIRKRIYTARQRLRSDEEIAHLRPSHLPEFSKRVVQLVAHKVAQREMQHVHIEEEKMQIELLGPGPEYKTAIKNLYAFYRYEMLMFNDYPDHLTPPADVTDDTWYSGAWVNQHGVINGIGSTTHEEAVEGEDVFWKWPNLQAYLIRLNGWPAGLACVASPPNATRSVDYRLQEFFIINKARRRGVGSAAARMLFDRLPGRWELSYNPNNIPATAFWRKFIPEYTERDFTEEMIGMGNTPDMPGYVFTRGPRPQHPMVVR